MKKVLYISYDGMTDPLGQSQVIPYLEGLAKLGYHFTILSFEKKDRYRRLQGKIHSLLDRSGIKWEPLWFTSKPPLISKFYDTIKMQYNSLQLYKKNGFDLVHCRSYVAAEAGLMLHKKTGIPFLFDMRGFWVDERVDSGQWKLSNPFFRFLYNIYKKKERCYLDKSSHIISLTYKGKEELIRSYHVPADKVTVIPCCVDMEHFNYHKISEEEKKTARKKLGITESKKVLSYLGSLGGWYMTDEMLDFFSVLHHHDSNTVFLFITHDNKEEIIRIAIAKKIPSDAIVVQPADRNEVPLYLSLSDWNIFFIKDAYSKKASSPTKQGEVMAMGIPIVCNDIGDTGSIINNEDAGILVKEFSRKEYERIIFRMLHMTLPNKESIRASAFKYYHLNSGVELYKTVYQKLIK